MSRTSCPASLSRVAFAAVLVAIAAGLAGCTDPTALSNAQRLDFHFRTDTTGWEAGFTDFPLGQEEDVDFDAGIRPLPDPLEGGALFHRGLNISDDLFMYFKRPVGGLEPGTEYRAKFGVRFASDVGEGCTIGIGPNVFVKAGAAASEPTRVVDDAGIVRLSVDKGSQRNSGENALLLGDIRNGRPGCPNDGPHVEETVTVDEAITVSDGEGELWLFFGTESAIEVTHELHFTGLHVELEATGG